MSNLKTSVPVGVGITEVHLAPGEIRKVRLSNGLPVEMTMKMGSARRPALAILGGAHFGLERDFIVSSGGNFIPVFDNDHLHIRAGLERVASLRVNVFDRKVVLRPT